MQLDIRRILASVHLDRTVVVIYMVSLVPKVILSPFMECTYDEISYSYIAQSLVNNGGWFDFSGSDIYFFPPLFNYLGALLCAVGVDRIWAMRTVSIALSSGIPVLIYLLMIDSGHSRRSTLIATMLWIISPYSLYYSIIGQVETPMLFFVILAAYLLNLSRTSKTPLRIASTSAIALCAAIWTKETAIGFIPIFLLLQLKNSRRQLFIWSSIIAVGVSPFIFQAVMPHEYNLFSEISPSRVLWEGINLDILLKHLTLMFGLSRNGPKGLWYTLEVVTLTVVIFSLARLNKEEIRRSFVLKFCLGSLVIFGVFFALYTKKHDYYLLLVYLMLVSSMGIYLSKKRILAPILMGVLFIACVGRMRQFTDWTNTNCYMNALAVIQKEKPGAKVALALPRAVEYLKEKHDFDIEINEVKVFIQSADKVLPEQLILDSDFYLGQEFYLKKVFCDQWGRRRCSSKIMKRYENLKQQLLPMGKWKKLNLYRVQKDVAIADNIHK
jgi:4-amino-4-deoxy-L-arabinose transferase-like glycosyltransferase